MPASEADGKPLVIVRADASAAIGLGHVMRSLTLARAIAEQGCRVRFIGAGIPVEARSDLSDAVRVSDRLAVTGDENDARSVLAEQPALVVVDGYHFSAGFFSALEKGGTPYAVIDDNCETAARSPALVLNQNPHATAELYSGLAGQPILLLGLEYALIRPEIVATARQKPAREPGTVFVSMGGSDPAGLTVPIVECLAGSCTRVSVALGPAHPARTEVADQLASLGGGVLVIEPDEFVSVLATCEVAVLAAGSSLWEAACLGTPTIALLVADNQQAGASEALRSGLAMAVHDVRDDSSALTEQLAELVVTGRGTSVSPASIVDGRGPERVADAVRALLRRDLPGSTGRDSDDTQQQSPATTQ